MHMQWCCQKWITMWSLDVSLLGWITVLLIASLLSYIYLTWPYNYFKHRGIPGPQPLPFVGNMNEMGKVPYWIKDIEWVKEYGKVFGFFVFGRKHLMISDKEMLREILIKDFDKFCDRTKFENRGVLKYAVFDMKGQAWKDQRNQLSPYFSAGTMKLSTPSINKILDNLVGWLGKKCDQGEMVEAKNFCEMMAIDVICNTAFGVEVSSCTNPDAELLRKSRQVFKSATTGNILFMLTLIFPTFGKLLELFNILSLDWSYLEKFCHHLIAERRKLTEISGHDLVNILLKERKGSGKGLTDNEIIANAILFLLAGYDTTAGTLSFLLYNLAVYPECQEKVFQEIQEHIGDQNPTYENSQQLTYLEMCIDETMRLFPLAPRLDRVCVKDTVVKGVAIEKGVSIVMPVWKIHRDPQIWESPETFNPERFTSDRKASRDPLDFVPFGVGPRHCIGMRLALLELGIAAVRILQKFKIVRNEKTQVPLEFDTENVFVVNAKNGVWLSLERRH